MAFRPGPARRTVLTVVVLALLALGVYAALAEIPRAQRPSLVTPGRDARLP